MIPWPYSIRQADDLYPNQYSLRNVSKEYISKMKTEWNELGVKLSEPILQTLKELNFIKTTPVQVCIDSYSNLKSSNSMTVYDRFF